MKELSRKKHNRIIKEKAKERTSPRKLSKAASVSELLELKNSIKSVSESQLKKNSDFVDGLELF